jgi:hypothetical protein
MRDGPLLHSRFRSSCETTLREVIGAKRVAVFLSNHSVGNHLPQPMMAKRHTSGFADNAFPIQAGHWVA